jgi:hypothetical protein
MNHTSHPHRLLHVLAVITNPMGYKSRTRLYWNFAKYMAQFHNVILWTIEGIYPGQDFAVTTASHPNNVQVRLTEPLWYKENLLNILLRHLPDDGQPFAWIDADVIFARPDWVDTTLEKLQQYDVVQPFSECQEMTDGYALLKGNYRRGMIAAWREHHRGHHHKRHPVPCPYPPAVISTKLGHCGYAWSMTRQALHALGGKILDHAIVGSADYQMATAFCGDVSAALPHGIHPGYRRAIVRFEHLVREKGLYTGFVDGLVLHNWHGKRIDRGYEWRDRILIQNQFNPETDLCFDAAGLMHLANPESERTKVMFEALVQYFQSRNEDQPT